MIRVRKGRNGLPRRTDPQCTLCFLSCDINQVMVEAREKVTDYQGIDPIVMFRDQDTLAYITDGKRPEIHISNLLNQAETPPKVILHIFVHELIHLVVPASRTDGRILHHTPAFWTREREASPEHKRVWEWLEMRWGKSLVRDADRECMCVKRSWKKRAGRLAPRVDW